MPDRGGMRRLVFAALAVMVAVVLASPCPAGDWVRVKWIPDGDTIVLEDGRHVRYVGIDAPEIDHDDETATPMGVAARRLNRQLVDDQRLQLEFDRELKDRYGRTLAYVVRSDGVCVNTAIVEAGWAWVLYRRPNISRNRALVAAQRRAMTQGKGIWRTLDRGASSSKTYWGNRRSKRFHDPDCPMARRISPRHRVRLNRLWDAFWAGYAPAKSCVAFPSP